MRKLNRRSKNHVRFDEERALPIFTMLAELWRGRQGFFADLVAPQQRYTPEMLRENPWLLGHWFSAMSLPMRGGIDSEAAFRFMRGLWERSAEFFYPQLAMDATPEELIAAIKATAHDVHESVNGQKGAGTLSYKLEEHVGGWIQNSRTLVEHWGGDIRNVFWGVTDFEEAFRRIDAERNNTGFVGMQRKIFSLLAMWLQEFGLIRKFPLPLIVDFHLMRFLAEQQIVLPHWSPLGAGKSKREDRKRPEALWRYPAAKVTEKFVNRIIMWSERFLARHQLSSYDVSHAIWFLSREFCAFFFGNRSETKSAGQRSEGSRPTKYGVTQRLVTTEQLADVSGWPKGYRDPCKYCPVESTCAIRVPAGPYYDWGVLVDAGPHVVYPGRTLQLPGIDWLSMPGMFGNSAKQRQASVGIEGGEEPEQLVLLEDTNNSPSP